MDLKTRAINMCTKPAAEWQVVAAESQTVAGLIQGYAAPLSAIGVIASFLALSVFSSLIGGSIVMLFMRLVVGWLLGLVGLYLCAIVVEKLAPSFQSSGDIVQALKMVVFASTPMWLAGVFNIVPLLSIPIILIAALYSIYVFYLGLTPVMKTPTAQVVPYMAVSAIVMIVISVVFGMVSAALFGGAALMGL